MVGLSVVLEPQKSGVNKKTPQIINKATMIITKPSPSSSSSTSYSSFPVPSFLQQCFLCSQKLLPVKDIYMYKGDRAFCSVECRCKQIFMDEEDSLRKGNCSLTAMRMRPSSAPSSSSSSSSSSSVASGNRKSTRNGPVGGFVY